MGARQLQLLKGTLVISWDPWGVPSHVKGTFLQCLWSFHWSILLRYAAGHAVRGTIETPVQKRKLNGRNLLSNSA